MTNAAAILSEGAPLVRRAAASAPAKVIALRTSMTPRNVSGLRAGDHQPRWPAFLALAMACPELRSFVARILALEQKDPRTEAVLAEIDKYLASRPEAGDQVQR